MQMIKPILSTAIAVALGAGAVAQAQDNVIVDINNNLYYTGLPPKSLPDNGSQIPPLDYPDVALTRAYYNETNVFDCLRNVLDSDLTTPNTHSSDPRRSCYGAEPEVLSLSDAGVSPGQTLYLRVTGIIDPDTVNDYKAPDSSPIPAVDARGQIDAMSSLNGVANYSLIGIWAKSSKASLDGNNEAAAAADADGDGNNNIFDVKADHGFVVLDGETEFGVVEEFGLTSSSTLVDADGDGVADVGSVFEFKGSTVVPTGASHLILAYNGHRGGHYHHGDPGYIGQSNPLYEHLTPAQRAVAGLLDNVSTEPDTFIGDAGFGGETGNYSAGHPRAVGVFMVTADDQVIPSQETISAPTPRFTSSVNGLVASFDASTSAAESGDIFRYVWDFGDGSDPRTTTGPTTEYTYSSARTATVTLTVMNTYFVSAQAKENITVGASTGDGGSTSNGGGGGGAFGLLALLPMMGLMRRRRR